MVFQLASPGRFYRHSCKNVSVCRPTQESRLIVEQRKAFDSEDILVLFKYGVHCISLKQLQGAFTLY